MFPEDLQGLLTVLEIDFRIDLSPDTFPIYIPAYRIAPAEQKELNKSCKTYLIRVLSNQVYLHGALLFVKKKNDL